MYKIEIHERINKIVESFHLLRLWRNEDVTGTIREVGCKLVYVLVQMSFAISIMSGGFLSDDKNETIYLTSAGIGTFVVSVKLIYILWKKENIRAFILELAVHSVEDHEEFIRVSNKVRKLMKFSSSFILMVFSSCVILTIFSLPVFSSEKRLPFNIWFPLDWKNDTFSFWIALIFSSIGFIISFVSVFLNVLLWYLMMNCAIKYQILGSQFRNMAPPTKRSVRKQKNSEAEKEKVFVQEFIGLIKTHQNIQETIDRFKSCFANLFFAQITTSGLCICGSVYVLAFGDENLPVTMVNVIIMTYNIFDIYMVMYFGNEIKMSSDRLSYCLFESNWNERSQSYKKYIIISTEVLKQPHELVIGKLYPLNLETFTSIVNTAYSMFNILQNFN